MKIHRKLRKGWILCCVFCLFPLTSLKECGISKSASRRQPRNVITWTGRIISGQESPKGAWPWQVSLELLHPRHGYIGHWCGGVLIYSQWVLTAAHCIHNDVFSLPLAALWTAVFGEWDRDVNEETEVRVPIEKIFVHERFNNYQNDIALLKLSRKIGPEEEAAGTVCLPEAGAVFSTSLRCMVTGWGHAAVQGSLVARLLESQIPLRDNSACQAKYGKWVAIRAGHLCAGHTDGSTGTCVVRNTSVPRVPRGAGSR
ncbi:chymotrypsin-like elastase family member 2A isoform X3 [Bacillus rossius redtenbacheri]|uniref:chymotrypsin-like elastase family member 2A isoform X3 n=1 Tax=Bacillus rossius redtenbacheri TaxID=93214 RepID=UPI002FDE4B7C